MKILKEEKNKNYALDTCEIDIENIENLNNKVIREILKLISEEPMYPKQIAKALNVHEQNIYYYIKKLEKTKIIEIERKENINGTNANFYTTSSDSFFFRFKDFRETTSIHEKESNYLNPFIEKGELNSIIVVGSPDPHGPQKARSRDGYFGMDLALFLGSFLNYVPNSKVMLDTEISQKQIEDNNLIVIGGPIVNKVTLEINDQMPIFFDEEKKGIYSNITKKTYFNDEIGIINKISNPYNKDKKILIVAGLRNAGTKSAILSFLKYFSNIKGGNIFDSKIESKVVEGIDLDSDGIVDDVEFLE
ncbi:MAG: S-layer protein [Candidatus Woesearchaeota archaeon]|jgi:DNA-binding transcriptional ArsR family regulator|nr:S-layer protein [Candidatus Woesearchaeota archaeon]